MIILRDRRAIACTNLLSSRSSDFSASSSKVASNSVTSNVSLKAIAISLLALWVTGFSATSAAQVSFEDVTQEIGPFHKGESWGAAWGDVNGDGYPDLAVNNHRHRHSMWINQAGQNFVDGVLQFDRSRVLVSDVKQDNHGSVFADIDNDGDQDLLNARSSAGGRPQLFINNNGIADEVGSAYKLASTGAGRLAGFYDYDRDGYLDMFYAASSQRSNKVFRNLNGRSFSNVTPSGYNSKCSRTNYYQFSSIDSDSSGLQNLDIACIKEGNFPQALLDSSTGDTNFIDRTGTLMNTSVTVDTDFADYDNDGDNDILVLRGAIRGNGVSLVAPNKIESWFISSTSAGPKAFSFQSAGSVTINSLDIARDSTPYDQIRIGSDNTGVTELPLTLDKNSAVAQGISTLDRNGVFIGYDPATSTWTVRFQSDRFADYYLVLEGQGDLTEPTAIESSYRDRPIKPLMFRNVDGSFERDFGAGFNDAVSCASLVSGDFDNDMDLDVYMACSAGVENTENLIYLNDGNGDFTPMLANGAEGVTGIGLDSEAGIAESVIIADYDVDGRLDLFTTNGALYVPALLGGPDQLFRNTTANGNNWIELDLVGVSVNRDAVGARITASVGDVTQVREQNGGYHRWSQNHKRIHFGLGQNESVDIVVDWPDGTQDNFPGLNANSLYEVVQGETPQAVTLGAFTNFPAPARGDECGTQPQAYDALLDQGVFLYKNCASGSWHLRAVSGNSSDTINISGTVLSGAAIASTTDIDIEGSDFVDVDGRRIDFSFNLRNANEDGFDFNLGVADAACIQIDKPHTLFVGEGHLPAPQSFNLVETGRCDLDVNGELNVPPSNVVSLVTEPFFIPGQGGSATQIIDLSGLGVAVGDSVSVTNLIADGDLNRENGSDEQFSLDFNGRQFSADRLYTGLECTGNLEPVTRPIDQSIQVVNIGNGVPGLIIAGKTTNEVGSTCGDVEYSLTISASPDLSTSSLACGMPDFSRITDQGIFVWRDCAGSGSWFVNVTGGGGSVVDYIGEFASDNPISAVVPVSFEGADTFSLENSAKRLGFLMRVANNGLDGLEFSADSSGKLCLTLNDPNRVVKVGAEGTAFVGPVNLLQGNNNCSSTISVADMSASEGASSIGVEISLSAAVSEAVSVSYQTSDGTATAGQDYLVTSGTISFAAGETSNVVYIPIIQDSDVEDDETLTLQLTAATNAELLDAQATITITDDEVTACGRPIFDSASDAGLFLWRDCGSTGEWFLEGTAGGGAPVDYTGQIVSDTAITLAGTNSFEGVDRADVSADGRTLDFRMKMGGAGFDGFRFTAEPINTCINIDTPAGQTIVVGAAGSILTPPFNISTLDPC